MSCQKKPSNNLAGIDGLEKKTMPNQNDFETSLFIFKCPECGDYFDSLNYSTNTTGREWGTAIIPDLNSLTNLDFEHNSEDSETGDWGDDLEYTCVDCEETISRTQIKSNSKVIEMKQSEYLEIIKIENYLEKLYRGKIKGGKLKVSYDEKPISGNDKIIRKEGNTSNIFDHGAECPKCHAVFQVEKKETFPVCVECGKEFERKIK